MVVNNMDNMMIEIKTNKNKFLENPIDAIINGDEIIPGITGKKVNIEKTYKNMKKKGYYSEDLYIYDYIKPRISINDNLDKYIIKGNPNKRAVSLIFKVIDDDNITDIVNILDNFNIKSTFFINENWLNKNAEYIKKLIDNGHTIAPLLDQYSDPEFEWIDLVIKNYSKKNYSFCYGGNYNKNNIESCKLKNNYTIRPTEISDNTPLIDIKSKLEPGILLSLKVNSQLKKELSTIIIYIKSKGFSMANLEDNVLE